MVVVELLSLLLLMWIALVVTALLLKEEGDDTDDALSTIGVSERKRMRREATAARQEVRQVMRDARRRIRS
jgi:hypothetical protein